MHEYDMSELEQLDQFADEYIKMYEEKCKSGTMNDVEAHELLSKIAHIKRTVQIAGYVTNHNKMAMVAAKLHDIGRFPQYDILGGFRDDLILHHNLGEDLITRMIFQKKLHPSTELDTIRQAIMYHGRTQFIPFRESPLTKEALEVTDIISEVDDLDNGCIGALGYIEGEIIHDSKKYQEKNPTLDMSLISPRVFEYFSRGEKFNKMTECHTYADYLLFAAVLAIQSLKGKHKDVAAQLLETPCFGYENAMAGYRDLFIKYLDPSKALEAYDIFYSFYVEAKGYDPNTHAK